MADHEGWSSDANKAIQISLLQPQTVPLKTVASFHPRYTHSIFGEEERIFGYQGLHIAIRFAAHNLWPNVQISYSAKFKPVGDTKATDIMTILNELLPPYAFDKSTVFEAEIQDNPGTSSFQPPGKLAESYSSKGRNYEIWCGELTDPAVRVLLDRMQIFVSFFIDGGTPIFLEDEEWTLARWRVFFVYEKLANPPSGSSSYSIVGYSTSYRFLTYQHTGNSPRKPRQKFTFPADPPISVSSLPSRSRISQFLILPPHQSHSHGSHLYDTMIKTFLADPVCTEITVEDPNEAFDDLRDYCDYNRLLRNGTLAQVKLNANIDPKSTVKRIGVRVPTSKLLDRSLLKNLREKNKIAPRQFERMVEMWLFSKIPKHNRQAGTTRLTQRAKAADENDRAYYYWRLLVKQRVYKQNKDSLIQLERPERIDKVEDVVAVLVGDYERLLRRLEVGPEERSEESNGIERKGRGKRKVIEDEDDYEDNDDGIPMGEERGRKRRREDEE